MAYARRFRSNRRRFGLKRRIAWKKPSPQNQKRQIFGLAKRVSYLSKVQRNRTQYGRYSITSTQNVSGDYAVLNLTDITQWNDVFNVPNLQDNRQKVKMCSFGIDNLFTQHTEPSPITFTYFMVSLKPGQGAKKLIEDAGESLGSLQADKHYTILQGMTMLNKDYFNIHYTKRFTLTSEQYTSPTDASNYIPTTFRRFYHKLSWPKFLNDGESAWSGMNENATPLGSRMYLLAFNDNSIVDLESPQWQCTAIATVKSS